MHSYPQVQRLTLHSHPKPKTLQKQDGPSPTHRPSPASSSCLFLSQSVLFWSLSLSLSLSLSPSFLPVSLPLLLSQFSFSLFPHCSAKDTWLQTRHQPHGRGGGATLSTEWKCFIMSPPGGRASKQRPTVSFCLSFSRRRQKSTLTYEGCPPNIWPCEWSAAKHTCSFLHTHTHVPVLMCPAKASSTRSRQTR